MGLTLALPDVQAAEGGAERAVELRRDLGDVYLERLGEDDFVGVQNYGRTVVGAQGIERPAEGVETNQMGNEFYPEGVGGAIRHAARVAGIPVYVTENGLATSDDQQRVVYYERAVRAVAGCIRDGIEVGGYFCWSAFDNFEWNSGYGPRFGIIAVDRETQLRTPKESARFMGAIARANAV